MRELVGLDTLTEDAYPEDILKAYYERHNEIVMDYFRHRQNDLLVINVSDPHSMKQLCEFLGHEYTGQQMPRLNESK